MISSFNAWSSQICAALIRASWQGAIFILAVALICRVFRGLAPKTRFWLWWLAGLQLAVRFFVVTPVALPVLPAVDVPVYLSVPVGVPAPGYSLPQDQLVDHLPPSVADPPMAFSAPEAVATASVAPTKPERLSAPSYLVGAWLIGVALRLFAAGRRVWRTRRMLRRADRVPTGPTVEIAAELSARLGIAPPKVCASAAAPCPLVAGWRWPTIVLPANWADARSEDEIRMAVAHELAHIRRRDMWLALSPVVAQTLFFFHPLGWLAAHEVAASCEEACDLEALQVSGGSPSTYARVLLGSPPRGTSLAALGASFSYRILQRRINMLRNPARSFGARHRRLGIALVALGALGVLPWTVTAQQATKANTPASTPGDKTKPHARRAKRGRVSHVRHAVARSKPSKVGPAAKPLPGGPAAKIDGAIAMAFSKQLGLTPASAGRPGAGIMVASPARTIRGGVVVAGPGLPMASAVPIDPPALQISPTAPALPANATPDPRWVAQTRAGGPMGGAPGRGFATSPAPGAPMVARGQTIGAFGGGLAITATSPGAPTGPGPGMPGVFVQMPPTPAQLSSGQRSWTLQPISEVHAFIIGLNGENAQRLSVHFQGTPLYTALQDLFKAAEVDFSISSDIGYDDVTCTLHQASLETALKTILKACARQHLTYRIEGGVYEVMPSDPAPMSNGGMGGGFGRRRGSD